MKSVATTCRQANWWRYLWNPFVFGGVNKCSNCLLKRALHLECIDRVGHHYQAGSTSKHTDKKVQIQGVGPLQVS